LVKALKELQTGFVLGSSDQADLQIVNLRVPFGEAGKALPPGQGYYSRRGRFRKIKAATAYAGSLQLPEWVGLIARRGD
jgi:hypothetical protein